MENHRKESFDFFRFFQRNFTLIFISLLFLYLLFAFLAPIFMHWGLTGPAKFIYSVYSNFCHQLAQRSLFLFGEQWFYPAQLQRNLEIKNMFDAFNVNPDDLVQSRQIIGNTITGYKVAICQRDIMLYASLLLFSLFYLLSKNRINKIPFWIWFLFGVLPMGIDGLWQLATTMNIMHLPEHESTPLIRSITGAFFGFFSGWYLLPMIQETFDDVENGTLGK